MRSPCALAKRLRVIIKLNIRLKAGLQTKSKMPIQSHPPQTRFIFTSAVPSDHLCLRIGPRRSHASTRLSTARIFRTNRRRDNWSHFRTVTINLYQEFPSIWFASHFRHDTSTSGTNAEPSPAIFFWGFSYFNPSLYNMSRTWSNVRHRP